MHKNPLWLAFLAFVCVVMLWYVGSALYRLQEYYALSATTKVDVRDWSVKEIASDQFAPFARYTFTANGKMYEGQSALEYPIYRNAASMEKELPNFSLKTWSGWYNPANPQQSSLKKVFPLKESISGVVMLGLLLYFIWLGYYVAKKQQ